VTEGEGLEPFRVYRYARMSARIGIVCMGMGMVSPCFCYAPWFAVLPLSAFGAVMARWAYDGAERKTSDRAYAKIGLITNVTSLILALMFNLTLAAYVGFIGLMIVGG
jgi:hypothetical protein